MVDHGKQWSSPLAGTKALGEVIQQDWTGLGPSHTRCHWRPKALVLANACWVITLLVPVGNTMLYLVKQAFPVWRVHFHCQLSRFLLEQDIRFGEVALKLKKLESLSIPWALALKAGQTWRMWSSFASLHLGQWALCTASRNRAVKSCSAHSCGIQIKRRNFSPIWEGMYEKRDNRPQAKLC